jgi:hypothetical protein
MKVTAVAANLMVSVIFPVTINQQQTTHYRKPDFKCITKPKMSDTPTGCNQYQPGNQKGHYFPVEMTPPSRK